MIDDIFTFLKLLRENNNREWFHANKKLYDDARAKVELITMQLIGEISKFEPSASGMRPEECLYRIYRDTRFSPDKTPYKRHFGIYINPFGGKKSQLSGYYLHLEPGASLVGGGLWCPPTQVLKAVRQDIYDNIEEYLEIIENPEFKKIYPQVGSDFLKTAPKGFPKDWEHISLLKPRDYTVGCNLTDRTVRSKDFIAKVAEAFRTLKPFNDFLNYTFEEHPDLPRLL